MALHMFERAAPALFRRSLSPLTRLCLVAAVMVPLMVADGYWHWGNSLRAAISVVLTPFQWLSAQPVKAVDLMGTYVTTVESAQQTREQAEVQLAQLALKAQRADLLDRENARLRDLLALQQQLPMPAYAAQIVHVAADPFTHKVVIDKGSTQGLVAGAPVIDGHGLLGQVVRVFPFASEVNLLDDPKQAVPVLNNRTGERSLVYGDSQNPRGAELEVRFLASTADVAVGDTFVTSGVGGIYPAGLPVGTVSKVEKRSNTAFLRVELAPAAQLMSVSHVLVLEPIAQPFIEGMPNPDTEAHSPARTQTPASRYVHMASQAAGASVAGSGAPAGNTAAAAVGRGQP